MCELGGKDGAFIVITGEDDVSRFSLAWANNHVTINGYNYTCLIDYEAGEVWKLYGFKVMESRTMIILNKGNKEPLEKYISEF